MFRVTLTRSNAGARYSMSLTIAECPPHGLPAIDWRRQHGLPARPTNTVPFGLDCESEALTRALPCGALTRQADLDSDYFLRTALVPPPLSDRHSVQLLYDVPCPLDDVRPLVLAAEQATDQIIREVTPEIIGAFSAYLRCAVAAHHARVAEETRVAEEAAAAAAKEAAAKVAASEARILADARAGRLYRQTGSGITRATDLM